MITSGICVCVWKCVCQCVWVLIFIKVSTNLDKNVVSSEILDTVFSIWCVDDHLRGWCFQLPHLFITFMCFIDSHLSRKSLSHPEATPPANRCLKVSRSHLRKWGSGSRSCGSCWALQRAATAPHSCNWMFKSLTGQIKNVPATLNHWDLKKNK